MNRMLSMLAGLLLLATAALASEAPAPDGYALDPSLTAKTSPRPAPKKSPFSLRANDNSAALQLVTKGAISPYVGASREEEAKEEETSSDGFVPESGGSSLEGYHLEAGFACSLNNNAKLNVGYRFADSLSNMMDEAPPALQEQTDDLRISLDLKLPF